VMLHVTDIHKAYGKTLALQGASLSVDAGSIVALLGRNGAGKSTLLSVVAGLTEADSGTVVVDGVDTIAHPRRACGLVGIAPQATGVYPTLTVKQNLEFFGELAGLKRHDRVSRAIDVAEQLGLSSLLERKGMNLSGGEARRLHTGCALVHRPKVLMLDEPTVGADVATRAQLIDAVKLLANEGAAIVYTTHYLPEVEALDASIVIIDNGTVLTTGTQRELIDRYRVDGLQFKTVGQLDPGVADKLNAQEISPRCYRVTQNISMQTLLGQLAEHSVIVESIETLKPDLESVFLTVTGSKLAEVSA
jgi:ABC-2 type transport system ATP-binding protein